MTDIINLGTYIVNNQPVKKELDKIFLEPHKDCASADTSDPNIHTQYVELLATVAQLSDRLVHVEN